MSLRSPSSRSRSPSWVIVAMLMKLRGGRLKVSRAMLSSSVSVQSVRAVLLEAEDPSQHLTAGATSSGEEVDVGQRSDARADRDEGEDAHRRPRQRRPNEPDLRTETSESLSRPDVG